MTLICRYIKQVQGCVQRDTKYCQIGAQQVQRLEKEFPQNPKRMPNSDKSNKCYCWQTLNDHNRAIMSDQC